MRDGRGALDAMVETWREARDVWTVKRSELGPLDDVRRHRRRPDPLARRRSGCRVLPARSEVTEDTRLSGDFVMPPRFAAARLERLAESDVPEHRACVEDPRRTRAASSS